jgi:hypothetical protein
MHEGAVQLYTKPIHFFLMTFLCFLPRMRLKVEQVISWLQIFVASSEAEMRRAPNPHSSEVLSESPDIDEDEDECGWNWRRLLDTPCLENHETRVEQTSGPAWLLAHVY